VGRCARVRGGTSRRRGATAVVRADPGPGVLRTIVGAVALLGVALALAGCREPTKLDAAKLVRDLPAAVVHDHPEVVTDVQCPNPIRRNAGEVTQCHATVAGTPVKLTVTQVDRDGHVKVEADRTLLDIAKVEADIATRLTKDVGIETSIVCDGPRVRVLVVGETLRCTATDPSGRKRVFLADVLDETGEVSLHLE
jgi:hypothetical protein